MIKSTKKRRKLFYPVGLLSLILLPIISISYINENDDVLKERIFPVFYWYPADTISKDEFSVFLQRENKIAMEHIRNLKYSDIYLTENDAKNNIEIKKGQALLKELVKSKDTTIGVHFHISNLAKFNYLIKVFNICKIEKANIYLPYKNDI